MVVISPAPPGPPGCLSLSVIQVSQPLSCCGAVALTFQPTLEHSSLSFCSMADSLFSGLSSSATSLKKPP